MALTRLALRALQRIGPSKIVLAAIPGGIRAVADDAGVTAGRVSQVLRQDPLPREWATRLAKLSGCSEWDVYHQLGQQPPTIPTGSRRDSENP
jgi:hypothetical protein